MKMYRTLFILIGGFLLCAGCGHVSGLDGLVPAEGTVTCNGEPVVNALVLLRPDGEGTAASATTDSAGRFSLMTFKPHDGVRPGPYVVTVAKTETRGDVRIERPEGTNQKIIHDNREIVNHLPEKYAAFSTTDIQIAIPKNGDRKITLALKGEVDATPQKAGDLKRRM